MNRIYDIFGMLISKSKQETTDQHIKSHKIRNDNLTQDDLPNLDLESFDLPNLDLPSFDLESSDTANNNEFSIAEYNNLIYNLYNVKITNPNDLETISRLELEAREYEKKYNIKNTEKIDAIIAALETYYDETKEDETLILDKRRGLYIYEDLSYKIHKLVNNKPLNQEKLKKLEQKLFECQEKYHLSEIEKIEAKIKALEKYEEQVFRNEENKNIGLSTYKNLIQELKDLKETNLKNNDRITQIESKIRKCSNQYNLTNLDKINIQLNILEEKY